MNKLEEVKAGKHMKRNAEFLLGLIGGIMGLCIGVLGILIVILATSGQEKDQFDITVLTLLSLFSLVQVAGIFVSCRIQSMRPKRFGYWMIAIGILSFVPSILFVFIPSALYLTSGGLALRTSTAVKESVQYYED